MHLSNVTQKFLTDAGWDESRRVDIAAYVDRLEEEGYAVNPFAEEFLSRFGGLELLQPLYNRENKFEKLYFDPLRACDEIYREKVETYEGRTGESLVVVGMAYNEYYVLMVSDTGKMYGAYDNFLALVGNTYEEALDTMFLCREMPEVT
ncbi:MAG: SUKH-3 domain-containing protein [Coriobacteriales bacterium]|jgi:hypothetical protein|nr:SUKH-3 domain-containing protein [Coriobacteriales bacterium]